MSQWKFFWCSLAADDFTVCGVPFEKDAFKFSLTSLAVDVVDPIYGKRDVAPVYHLQQEDESFEVAHKEWTPGVYLAFANVATLLLCRPKFRWDPVVNGSALIKP
jgi:hypothetical protein